MVKISIVTPCYNARRYIDETIQSVITQKGDFEIEYFIIDGGSTDGTLEIIERYAKMIDSGSFVPSCQKVSLTYISEPDHGMYDALVKGFRMVTGDIIAYINSDDYYQPNAFSAVEGVFNRFPEVEWIIGMQLFYNEQGNITHTWVPYKYGRTWILKGMYGTILPFIQQESTFWRKELLNRVDVDRLKTFRFAGDFYLWHTFAHYTDLYLVKTLLGGFRTSSNQLSKQMDKYYEEFLSIAYPRRWFDMVFGYCLKVLLLFMSDEVKLNLNRRNIRYDGQTWWKTENLLRRVKQYFR
jgi:glycosyltransferase involved in cell wall biosynthesis